MSDASAQTPGSALSLRSLVRGGASLLLLLLGVWALGIWLEEELRWLGGQFVARFGLWGMMFGTWLADGFCFPVPPQFYMLMALTGGVSQVVALLAIAAGSMLGGITGYLLAPQLARWGWIARAVQRTRPLLHRLSGEGWLRGVALVSVTPFAFSWLCYASGLYRLPKRALLLICLLRLPKLFLYQWLVRWGWYGLS